MGIAAAGKEGGASKLGGASDIDLPQGIGKVGVKPKDIASGPTAAVLSRGDGDCS